MFYRVGRVSLHRLLVLKRLPKTQNLVCVFFCTKTQHFMHFFVSIIVIPIAYPRIRNHSFKNILKTFFLFEPTVIIADCLKSTHTKTCYKKYFFYARFWPFFFVRKCWYPCRWTVFGKVLFKKIHLFRSNLKRTCRWGILKNDVFSPKFLCVFLHFFSGSNRTQNGTRSGLFLGPDVIRFWDPECPTLPLNNALSTRL